MAIKLGNTVIEYPIFLAPMAGVSDYSFRKICRLYGASLTVTEMISAKAVYYKDTKTADLARLRADEGLCCVQIFGSEPDIMAYAAEKIATNGYHACKSEILPVAIDINMGCPVRKVVTNGEGSALMKDPEKIRAIVSKVRSAIDIPLTVKIRAGWDERSINAVECALAAEDAGASLICVHGRTREQMYSPPVSLDVIRDVKKSVRIPVIGNGGINTPEDARLMLEHTGCDGLALARGARGNPHLFSQIRSLMKGEPYREPTRNELLDLARLHLELLTENKGEEVAVREARGHLIWYVRGFHGAPRFRDDINRAESAEALIKLLEDLRKINSGDI